MDFLFGFRRSSILISVRKKGIR